jgi:hypothetical protein
MVYDVRAKNYIKKFVCKVETPVKKLTKPTEQKVYHQIVWA